MQRIIRNRPGAIKALVDELSAGYDQVTTCYEAGACGFELYRRITDLGALCVVIAPASLPKKANDRVKTDRRYAVKRAKQRLVHFLPRHEIRCEGARNWSAKDWAWLRSLAFDSPMMALTFEEYVGQITRLEETRKRIADRLEAVAAEERYEARVKTLRAIQRSN